MSAQCACPCAAICEWPRKARQRLAGRTAGADSWTSGAFRRSCVGRNLASLELLVIVASIFRRYEFVLEDPEGEVRGAFHGRGYLKIDGALTSFLFPFRCAAPDAGRLPAQAGGVQSWDEAQDRLS